MKYVFSSKQNGFKMSSSSAQVAGPDTFARRYPSPTQCHFYGLGVTHQNTFTADSVQHLFSVYCHLLKERCLSCEMPSPPGMLMLVLQLIAPQMISFFNCCACLIFILCFCNKCQDSRKLSNSKGVGSLPPEWGSLSEIKENPEIELL